MLARPSSAMLLARVVRTRLWSTRLAFPTALHKANRHAPLIASAVILLLFGLYLAGRINDWLQLERTPPTAASSNSQPADIAPDIQRMESLFGAPPERTNTSTFSGSELTLHGSFVHADPIRSTAIVQRAGQPPQLYRIGEELEPGLSLHSVYPDRVDVLRDGQIETLLFPSTRSASALTDYSEQAMPAEQPDPQVQMLQQQLDALHQQTGGNTAPTEDAPADQPATEDD